MLDDWIANANGFLLVYSIDNLETFEGVKNKVERMHKNNVENPIIIVGNKNDLIEERKVTKEIAEEYAKSIGAKYYETSALTDLNGNCKIIFQECASLIANKATNGDKIVSGGVCCKCSIFLRYNKAKKSKNYPFLKYRPSKSFH